MRAAAVLALILLLSTEPARAEGTVWAVVVGIDRYDNADVTPLQFAAADARAVAAALRQSLGATPDHVVLMTADAKGKERPTSVNVLGWLEALKATVKPDDTLVFYFSGHGYVQEGESFLLTVDANLGSLALMKRSCLSVKEVQQALKDVRAARVLQIVDACRNDPKGGRATGDNPLSRDLVLQMRSARRTTETQLTATLFACSVGQRSYEGLNGHGYFTWYLVKGIQGDAAGADGQVSLTSLVDYLERTVSEAVRFRENGREQTPWADISGTGASRWILGKGATPAVATRAWVQPTDASWGLWTGVFETPRGKVTVHLPRDLAVGDSVSGAVVTQVVDANREANAAAMGAFTLECGGKRSPLTQGRLTLTVPGTAPLRVTLRDASGQALGSLEVPLGGVPRQAPSTLTAPTVAQGGRPLALRGTFDGNADNTTVTIADRPARVLAETRRACIVETPREVLGAAPISVTESGRTQQARVQCVRVRVQAGDRTFARGERVSVTVTVEGLAGLAAGNLSLKLAVQPQDAATFVESQSGLLQRRIEPGSDGTFVVTTPLEGIRAANIQMTAVVAPDE